MKKVRRSVLSEQWIGYMRMYGLILLLILDLSVYAQKNRAENTLLWEISGKSLKKRSYLFGTYHFADKGFVDTMKTLNEKLKAAEAVVGELIMDSTVPLKLMPYMSMKGNTLDKLLSQNEYKLVADYLEKIGGGNLVAFNTMKPVVLQIFILQAISPVTFTKANPQIDQYFQDYGKENKKKILGLETAEEQAVALFGNSLGRQKQQLLKMIREEDKIKMETHRGYRNYITQNLTAIEKEFTNNEDFTKEEMNRLLKNRNQKWLQKLPSLMQEQSLFIVVGAGHLIGKDGLIKGLQTKGYTVMPIATN